MIPPGTASAQDATRGARPQGIGVDDRALDGCGDLAGRSRRSRRGSSLARPDQWPLDLGGDQSPTLAQNLPRCARPSRRALPAPAVAAAVGERMRTGGRAGSWATMSFGTELGFSVFHAGHWLWHRPPHSAQVASVEHALPREVLDASAARRLRIRRPGPRSRSFRAEHIARSGPSAFGCRFAPTLDRSTGRCRCLLLSTKIRKPNTTAMLISRNAVSSNPR